jgi:hypothetical protein
MSGDQAAEGFLRHKGLILVAAGGAVAEAGLLTLLAPAARAIAPQFSALPGVAAYHDLRWLFADTQSWLWFAGVVTAVLVARSALDVALLRLAWPRSAGPPALSNAFASCLVLTALAWLVLSPAATLTFGVAVLPFSWPFLAAMPIVVGITAALSHGGVLAAWWRRLPPARAVGWLLASFLVLTAAAAVIAHAGTVTALLAAAVAGLANARAWYGMAGLAARLQPRAPGSVPSRLLLSLPFAPFAAIMVLAVVVGMARLMFTGAIHLTGPAVGGAPAAAAVTGGQPSAGRGGPAATGLAANAVLVVGGWGSSCCDAADGLRGQLPGVTVRQFSYLGMTPAGRPMPSGPQADDLPLPELGDRIAAQVRALSAQTGQPVAVVAESEGTLGVYAMLARDPGAPVSSVTLLSPIVGPGQLSYPSGPDGASASEYALDELNRLVGGMSPYGPSGAQHLLSSVSEYGARYFAAASRVVHGTGRDAASSGAASAADRDTAGYRRRWLVVIPLADAVTLPVCALPANVVVVPAFHGGLLGEPQVLRMVTEFLDGRAVSQPGADQLRTEAELISGASAAWRMPDTGPACPVSSR